MSLQFKSRGTIFLLLTVIAFVLACNMPGLSPDSPTAFDPTKAALELQNTAIALQLTQSAPKVSTQPPLSQSTSSPMPTPSNQIPATPAVTQASASGSPTPKVTSDIKDAVERYYQKAYLSSTEGEYVHLKDYSRDWAKIGYQDLTDTGQVVDNFMVRAHFAWQSATQYPDPSGCGYAFRVQGRDYYLVFVDKETVWLGIWTEYGAVKFRRIGANSGSGMTGNITEADVTLIVNQGKAVVLINENFVGTYVLSTDYLTGSGGLSYLVVSGTNRDYGTRCKMTNVDLWKIK